ncbi:retrovirus-related Pol polyprotein from transposon opus [Trichonephila clavipes]|nr:retrovirus-related Pol polyprotein from transposon opus [Trichonephila clavipes]GFX69481.1 retrovirus-related Pol polyprotein from transposon opus [Trichonephila clavipes]
MPFGLSGAAPNFQKAIDMILKPVLGRFVSVHMDDVIISSPSFTHFKAGLTLNKSKCHFASEELKYLSLVINNEGVRTDESKVKVITEMKLPKNAREVAKFLGMTGWYQKLIRDYAEQCRCTH